MVEGCSRTYTLLDKFWRISLYFTEHASAKLSDVEFRQIEGNRSNISSHRAKELRVIRIEKIRGSYTVVVKLKRLQLQSV